VDVTHKQPANTSGKEKLFSSSSPCGKSVYFDLKDTFATVSGATSAWLRTCPKKDELELV
jgi:hypothetical protein